MGTGNFTDEFKRDAVAQITERGYWSCPRFAGHSGGCGLSCDELARRAHFQP